MMKITMTLEVSPEQAETIAKLLCEESCGAATPADTLNKAVQPTQPQAIAPTPAQNIPANIQAQGTPVQSIPVQQTMPIQQGQVNPVNAIPTQVQQYSVQDLCMAARPLMEAGKGDLLHALLAEFDVAAVAAIPENRRAEFAARLRTMGGQI